ncbi:MAG: hypothetical protein Q8922_08675 [Bacteroidota bacterium]|nr:hypothetical protein [Bacteroidota bacterium]MDP4234379.1 hypothetical protein [Bacteroidota bacterium]MDP4243312.1 hypothetical protein [Bacteroidota bacterium]MDP4287997.1 hypothetical protein [Bacteroidota bacterium]
MAFSKAFVLVIVTISLSAATLTAQPKGTWTKTKVSSYGPMDIAFGDSLYGFVLTAGFDQNVHLTTDGGRTFFSTARGGQGGSYLFNQAFSVRDTLETHFFTMGESEIDHISFPWHPSWYIIHPEDTNNTPLHFPTSNCLGWPTPDTGFITSGSQLWLTGDGGAHFLPVGEPLNTLDGSSGAIAVTTREFFAIPYLTWFDSLVAHSTDQGGHWTYTRPIDSTSWPRQWANFSPVVKGYEPGHFFLTGGRIDTMNKQAGRIDDYLESTDDGATWKIVSDVSHGRVWRMANPGKDILWLAVGRVPQLNRDLVSSADGGIPKYNGILSNIVDSMFYTSDNGATWYRDGTTFAGDTICAMRWVSPTNGFVLTCRDGATWLYHYSEGPAAVEQHPLHSKSPIPQFYPNPASTKLTVDPAGQIGLARIVDPLGCTLRIEAIPQNGLLHFNLAALPPGPYFLLIGNLPLKFVKG